VVLSSSQQCVPILQFDACDIAPNDFGHRGHAALCIYHNELQHMMDDFFEVHNTQLIAWNLKSKRARRDSGGMQVTPETVQYTAPR
jgi:hypothetical protein